MNLIDKVGKQVDVIFADPPYFLSKNISRCINGVWKTFEKGEWDRVASFEKLMILTDNGWWHVEKIEEWRYHFRYRNLP